ncbi:hypothetical protein I6N95_24800 [Vagococcus sp. BWB3-3]|uniref:Uncharacterized protein n=1 Tax=Vagococcus allomyrinae TaxID=2794353 RepID=A0A940SZA7_9ENTE|nr:hypothetical protein [Vagococcus allomyrinae]MBP1044233.1 hypothetical protein [Vagococcus allomyrinae]
MKRKRISYDEYEQLKVSLKGLAWTWQSYQDQFPNGWYDFKYSPRLRQFIDCDQEESLLSQGHYKSFPKRVVFPQTVYNEIKELTLIHEELLDVLAHPPYGTCLSSQLESRSTVLKNKSTFHVE